MKIGDIVMPWSPWIKIEEENSVDGDVKKLYKKARNPLTNKISDLTRLTSTTPNFALKLYELSAAVYQNTSGLTAREKEIAALVTSTFVGCVH